LQAFLLFINSNIEIIGMQSKWISRSVDKY